jgi:hypothetical protein
VVARGRRAKRKPSEDELAEIIGSDNETEGKRSEDEKKAMHEARQNNGG